MKVAVEDLVHSHEADLMFESKEDHDERHRDERKKGDPEVVAGETHPARA